MIKIEKIVVIGDPHTSDVAPSSRLDDYKEVILGKLEFIRDWCNSNNVDVAILAGDVFHRKNPNLNSHYLTRRLIEIFGGFNCPVIEVPGNHDISMTSKNLDKQPLSVIAESGAIQVLGFPYTKTFVLEGDNADIYGLGYADANDLFSENYFAINSEITDLNKLNILAIHQMLLPDGDTFFGDFLNFAEVAQLDFDIFICGHYHPGYDPRVQFKHGKVFINPGSIARGSIDVHNLDRQPSFTVLDITSNPVKWEEVVIPHEHSSKVFDLQKVRRSLIAKEDMESFTTTLKNVTEETIDIASIDGLLSFLSASGAEKDILDFTKPYFEKAFDDINII